MIFSNLFNGDHRSSAGMVCIVETYNSKDKCGMIGGSYVVLQSKEDYFLFSKLCSR